MLIANPTCTTFAIFNFPLNVFATSPYEVAGYLNLTTNFSDTKFLNQSIRVKKLGAHARDG